MQSSEDKTINDPNFLRILIEINQWEDKHGRELQTVSGRGLYFRIVSTLLNDTTNKKQPLKLLSGRITDRATRNRIREFQALGLVKVLGGDQDARTKRVMPTEKFIERLNSHSQMFRWFCNKHYLMLDKDSE